MKKIIKITESDLTKIIKRVLKEEEESIDLNSRTDFDKIIKSDFRREEDYDRRRRQMDTDEAIEAEYERCISSQSYRKDKNRLEYECRTSNWGYIPMVDLIFGYKMVMDIPKTLSNKTDKMVIASKALSPPTMSTESKIIIYYCPGSNTDPQGGLLEYRGLPEPDEEQEKRDDTWLAPYCDSIDWKSKVGKKRNLVTKPKIEI